MYVVKQSILKIAGTLLCWGIFFSASAQRIDNFSTFREINHSSYFRLHYDNDYFTKTDYYYSQGVGFEYVAPGFKKFFLSKLLWRPFNTKAQYGIVFNSFGFTPIATDRDDIPYGDRPYDANVSLKFFSSQVDEVNQQQLTSAFSIGATGPIGLGKEIQTEIHRHTPNSLPHGWQFQIQNDAIVNYQLNYEKLLVGGGNHFELNGAAEARVGTYNDAVSAGFNFMAGRFNKRFMPVTYAGRKAEYYFFGQAKVNAIGYDASMQGGMFRQNSPYKIAASDINRLTYQADAGIVVNFKRFYLSYTQSILSKEFATGKYHRWGGISIGFAL